MGAVNSFVAAGAPAGAASDEWPVIHAAEEGSIYLTLLPPDAPEGGSKGPAADARDIFGGP